MKLDHVVNNVLRRCAAVLLLAAVTTPAAAQLPSAATAGLGMAENYTAAARGYNATAWNPANLGLRGNPSATLAFFPVRAIAGLGPITLGDVKQYGGLTLDATVRQSWLNQITNSGSEKGTGGADVSEVALQVGNFGFHIGTSVHATAHVPPGAAQLILFGNEDPTTGAATTIVFDSARVNAAATSTVALAYGKPFTMANGQRVSFGATVKYTIGHVMLYGQDQGSKVTANPISLNVQFPTITTDTGSYFNNGSGIGLDLGGAWQNNTWTVAAAVQNVFNSFKWSESKLRYRPARAVFTADSSSTQFDEKALILAPADLRARVADQKFQPAISVGAAFQPNDRLTVDADFRTRFNDDQSISFEPKMHVGVGAEFRVLSWLPLRAGFAKVTDGTEVAAGIGINIGSFSIAGSYASRSGNLGNDKMGMITLISSWPGTGRR
jgi:hypothetical protein